MGYTHYWKWKATPDRDALKRCIAEMKQVIDAVTGPERLIPGPDDPEPTYRLCGWDGRGLPAMDPLTIRFNGDATTGMDHETFAFPGDVQGPKSTGFNFCKTARKPYDEALVACLLVARDHFPKRVLEITSDGEWADEWTKGADPPETRSGVALYERVFKRKATNPLKD